jgi:hypothetical protein
LQRLGCFGYTCTLSSPSPANSQYLQACIQINAFTTMSISSPSRLTTLHDDPPPPYSSRPGTPTLSPKPRPRLSTPSATHPRSRWERIKQENKARKSSRRHIPTAEIVRISGRDELGFASRREREAYMSREAEENERVKIGVGCMVM